MIIFGELEKSLKEEIGSRATEQGEVFKSIVEETLGVKGYKGL